MTERLLQFIWQFQYFNKSELTSDSGETVKIIAPGQYNTHQGPDFSNAKIEIGDTLWAGNVELHVKTSDWKKHKHQEDSNYKNVVLHVVWEDDGKQNSVPFNSDQDRTPLISGRNRVPATIPVIELKGRVSLMLLQRYEELMKAASFIACEKSILTVPDLTWKSWKERLLAERLLRKAKVVETYLQQNNYHWEETFWWLLARSFGMKVNADAFESIARSIPLNVLARHKQQVHQLEALLLGQGGLLEEEFREDYPKSLSAEYRFQHSKYKLKPGSGPLLFLRMRPGNFPTIRLAQLAMLVHESAHLFSKIKEADSVKNVKEWFNITASEYWHYHYQFDVPSAFKKKIVGSMMVDTIIINTVAPVLFAYGQYYGEQKYKDRALQWLEETAAEKNYFTNSFQKIGISNKNAYDSQALIELKTQYCERKMCLDCGVGNYLLKTKA